MRKCRSKKRVYCKAFSCASNETGLKQGKRAYHLRNLSRPQLYFTADHLIENIVEFQRVIQSAKTYANQGRLVTFGIVPTSAETGYGYIESKEFPNKKDQIVGLEINKFIEKPKKAIAEKLIKDSRYTWNSGMFLFRASSILNELETRSFIVLIKLCCASNGLVFPIKSDPLVSKSPSDLLISIPLK